VSRATTIVGVGQVSPAVIINVPVSVF